MAAPWLQWQSLLLAGGVSGQRTLRRSAGEAGEDLGWSGRYGEGRGDPGVHTLGLQGCPAGEAAGAIARQWQWAWAADGVLAVGMATGVPPVGREGEEE